MTERRGPVIKKLRGTAGPPVCRFYLGWNVRPWRHQIKGYYDFSFHPCLICYTEKIVTFSLYFFRGEIFDRSFVINFYYYC